MSRRARFRSDPGEFNDGFRWRSLLKVVLALLVVAGLGALFFLKPWEQEKAPKAQDTTLSSNFETLTSAQGGYEFDYPPEWTLSDQGTFTRVSSPKDEIIVSFGVAPPGDLLVSSESLIELLRETYPPLEAEESQLTTTSGFLSMVSSGEGTSESGERFTFEAMILETSKRNYALLSFESIKHATNGQRVLAERVIDSFRLH